MDSTTDDSSIDDAPSDEFERLSARPNTPGPAVAPAFGSAFPTPTASIPIAAPPAPPAAHPEQAVRSRLPELMGADELAAAPRPFPPPRTDATPLVAPPMPEHILAEAMPLAAALAVIPSALAPSAVPAPAPAPAPAESARVSSPDPFASLLVTPSMSATPLRLTSTSRPPDEPDIARSTIVEKISLVLAVILPPIGLIVAILAAVGSARRRGWVIGLLRAAIAIGVVLSVLVGIAGYLGYKQVRTQQAHDQTVAASAAFCSTIQVDPTMMAPPDFGWPTAAASIPDSIAAMQAYVDKWTKLAEVSPPGVAAGVTGIVTSATQILDSVMASRTVDDASNIENMTSAASASGVSEWYAEYCA